MNSICELVGPGKLMRKTMLQLFWSEIKFEFLVVNLANTVNSGFFNCCNLVSNVVLGSDGSHAKTCATLTALHASNVFYVATLVLERHESSALKKFPFFIIAYFILCVGIHSVWMQNAY